VRTALEATAAPVTDAAGNTLPFWEAGYGHVDLAAAVNLVRSKNWAKQLAGAQTTADQRALGSTGFTVPRSDFWTWDAPRAAIAGSDSRTFAVAVPATVTHLKVTLSHPSLTAVGLNEMNYTVTVRDAADKLLGTTTESDFGAGTASLFVDLRTLGATAGAYTFHVSGDLAASDPDTLDSESALGRVVVLQVAQLKR